MPTRRHRATVVVTLAVGATWLASAESPKSVVPTVQPDKDWYGLSKAAPPHGPGAQLGVPYSYALNTHCGIHHASFAGRWWKVETPLPGDQVNAPPGWSNPYEPGTMTLIAPDLAVFKRSNDEELRFRLTDEQPPPCM